MDIAIIGYGKMGHAVERIAIERGHRVVARIDVDNRADFDSPEFRSAQVAIEFSTPATAIDNILAALSRGVAVVSGTTGWRDRAAEVEDACLRQGGAMLWASNFSIGVNIFNAVNRYLSRLMDKLPQYSASIKEIHHIHKLDHPSGTAITLAEGLIDSNSRYDRWAESEGDASTVVIDHEREGEVPGTHIITWDSPVDTITIEHRAKSRDGFALGAVMAAEWLAGRTGVYSIEQMLHDLINI